MPICSCGESYDEGDSEHAFCQFDSDAPEDKTLPSPPPHEAETWPPAEEEASLDSSEHHSFRWSDPPADLAESLQK